MKFARMDFVDFGTGVTGTVFDAHADGSVSACTSDSGGRIIRFTPAATAKLLARDFKNISN
jgi:hypothetical protein